jgi:hypothetical protein
VNTPTAEQVPAEEQDTLSRSRSEKNSSTVPNGWIAAAHAWFTSLSAIAARLSWESVKWPTAVQFPGEGQAIELIAAP